MRAIAFAGAMLLVSTAAFGHQHGFTFKQRMGHDTCLITLTGTAGPDTLGNPGTACIQDIYGHGGNDTLTGGLANDYIEGGYGQDVMTGGAGNDTFGFLFAGNSTPANPDEIADFNTSADIIDISSVCTNAMVTCTWIGNAGFSNTAGEVGYHIIDVWFCDPNTHQCRDIYTTYVDVDLDGDGNDDMTIALDTQITTLSASNFVF